MIGQIPTAAKQHLTTALFSKHKESLLSQDNHFNDQGDSIQVAARIPVIKSTVFIPDAKQLENMNQKKLLVSGLAESKQQPEKKPYGGRPLKYECTECKRRFHAPSHLKRHVMSHSSERPFHCQVCGKGFLQAWHLGRHMTTHTGNKPFKCLECSKSFGSRFEMKTHVNYIHRGIKEHQCGVCGKNFTLRSNLKVHMRKHTGEKPYKCTFCSKRFGQRGHLQYHIRKHEGKEDIQSVEKRENDNNSLEINRRGKLPSVSDNGSDCHDDDVSMTSDRDSGIGSYDSEVESITASSCSSPTIRDLHDDQLFNCENACKIPNRQPSPEFGLVSMVAPCFSRKETVISSGKSTGIKPYVCYSCNCGFAEVNSLRAHVRHSHPRKGIESGDYRCAYCLKSYQFINELERHVQENHQANCRYVSSPEARFASKKRSYSQSSQDVTKPKMSAKSLAFSIENLCADVLPKKKKSAEITHLHLADSLVHSKDPCFSPLSPGPPSRYGFRMDALEHYPGQFYANFHSHFTYPNNMHPMCIY